jgi:hypothetical protein
MSITAPAPKKVSKATRLGIGCLALIALCIVLAVIGSFLPKPTVTPTSATAPIATAAAAPTNATAPRPANTSTPEALGLSRSKPLPFGQIAHVGILDVAVERVRFDDGTEVSKGAQYLSWQPEEGKVFLLVDVLLKNTGKGDQSVSVSPIDFAVMGSANVVYGYTITGASTIDPPRGTMLPGGELRGTLLFSVQKGETGLVLQCQKFLEKTAYMDVMPR